MAKLGYTWYPKDFASDPDVMLMSASQRGIYRDLIDLAYQTENRIAYSLEALSRYTNGTVDEVREVLNIKAVLINNEYWTIPNCNKRLKLSQTNSENGKKGGRPKSEKKAKQKPNEKRNESETQSQREREREDKIELIRQKFKNDVLEFKEYPETMLMKFIDYWTELTPSKTKMKFQLKETWETKRRLEYWHRNEQKEKTVKPTIVV